MYKAYTRFTGREHSLDQTQHLPIPEGFREAAPRVWGLCLSGDGCSILRYFCCMLCLDSMPNSKP